MGTLKVAALISGGKDSFFSILHCLANGHDVVALANLHPPVLADGSAVDDTDSFMYQTIGHAVIPLYEEALGLPLYRQAISGSAVNASKNYGPHAAGEPSEHDETEDLTTLLVTVIKAHPEVNAVSTGAILSDYQRTRVESVALRLGLTPLSYLWQYPTLPPSSAISLLDDMAAAGQDARLVKVASGGLDDTFLWENVADARTRARLVKASDSFGTEGDGSALGEGGEYETLAISGPPPLWKKRIHVSADNVEIIPGEAGSASVRLHDPRLVSAGPSDKSDVRIPDLLDTRFHLLQERLASLEQEPIDDINTRREPALESSPVEDGTLLFENIVGYGQGAAEQAADIMRQLQERLTTRGISLVDVVYASITLRDLADFVGVNAAYGRHFQYANPPSRVTLACADVLPKNAALSISVTAMARREDTIRTGMHVQSRSYWAPANIGPYSQAIAVPANVVATKAGSAVVYIAGQIPLLPATMELYQPGGIGSDATSNFASQAVLALQHLYRVGRATKVRSWITAIALLTAKDKQTALNRGAVTRRIWHDATRRSEPEAEGTSDEDDADFDVWDQQRRRGRPTWQRPLPHATDDSEALFVSASPLVVILVDDLPRGASVEEAETIMAPDLNAVAARGQFDYSQFGSGGYEIRQDVTWGDPKNRKLKVLTIGGGVSGILMAYQIQKLTENVEHVIYEKNEDIAGTWLENRYPGCACDIPSHAYTYNFALNPDWPRFFSYSPDIFKYLEKVVSTFDLRKYMTFNTEVTGCFWNEEKGQWLVKLRQTKPGQEPRELEDTCDLLLHGTGILNNFKWPDIPGLKDKFKGKVVHTARWPKDYQKEQWANDR
ncbi:hypothetical protein LTR95_012260, partial [Oleoguttula sp. CCFEE 5521]